VNIRDVAARDKWIDFINDCNNAGIKAFCFRGRTSKLGTVERKQPLYWLYSVVMNPALVDGLGSVTNQVCHGINTVLS
jgi:hypothetical protein